MTVTVITSTIGRPELRQCLESVRSQTYKANHLVFVNGLRFHESAREMLKDFPEVQAIFLLDETGNYNGYPSCGGVFAGAPYLTSADWIFYLNDDDFYDPNHVESVMDHVKANDLKWAYSLRRLVTVDGKAICDDDWCSLGHYPIFGTTEFVVDNSCFAVSRALAERYGRAWTVETILGDRYFLMALKESGARYGCTGLSTVNYRIGTGTAKETPEFYLDCARGIKTAMPDGFPWRSPQVFGG